MPMEERRRQIMEDLVASGSVSVGELAHKYSVTYETIRKDLSYLEERGYVIKGHGEATLKRSTAEMPFGTRAQENGEAKAAVARAALEFIPEGGAIIVCTGSTVLELAKLLMLRQGLKVFTDSLPAASLLVNSENQSFFFGGELRRQSSSTFGGWTIEQIRQIQADVCFMGTDGFSGLGGPSSPSSSDAFVDREVLEHSDNCYVLADHTKFTRRGLYKICDWEDVSRLITNRESNPELVAQVQQHTTVTLA